MICRVRRVPRPRSRRALSSAERELGPGAGRRRASRLARREQRPDRGEDRLPLRVHHVSRDFAREIRGRARPRGHVPREREPSVAIRVRVVRDVVAPRRRGGFRRARRGRARRRRRRERGARGRGHRDRARGGRGEKHRAAVVLARGSHAQATVDVLCGLAHEPLVLGLFVVPRHRGADDGRGRAPRSSDN
eukprot:31160-Pelagococcus_subviridis.AAC.13